MFKLISRVAISLVVVYAALFGLTKIIHYPEPIATIRLGLAPASKTPDLMPSHWIVAAPTTFAPWQMGIAEEISQVTWNGKSVPFEQFLEETDTNAFLVIRKGKITYEKYFNGKQQSTVLPSYSVA